MPKVTFVKKARKNYPEHGIKKGESYYHWGTRIGSRFVRRVSKTAPRRSQLTNSEFLSTMYDCEDNFSKAVSDFQAGTIDFEDLASACDEAASEIQNAGEECQGKFDNMPEGLQQGDTGQLLENRVQQCDELSQNLEQAASEIRDLAPNEEKEDGTEVTEDEEKEADDQRAEAVSIAEGISWEYE